MHAIVIICNVSLIMHITSLNQILSDKLLVMSGIAGVAHACLCGNSNLIIIFCRYFLLI